MSSTQNTAVKDGYLQGYLSTVDKFGMELGITLNVNGTLISGVLINSKQYLIGVEESFKNSMDEVAQAIGNSFKESRLLDESNQEESDPNDDEEDDSPFNFIHLKNVKMLLGGIAIPTNGNVYWRGKVDSVDGFIIGNLGS